MNPLNFANAGGPCSGTRVCIFPALTHSFPLKTTATSTYRVEYTGTQSLSLGASLGLGVPGTTLNV